MGDRSIQQRLAAVLAADVVGYTRLMEKDTEGTVAAWQAVRDDVINPTVDAHSGRIVKLTGDGFLAEFPTVHEAVKCGIAMQEGFADSPLEFRIGINLGDIIDDGQDIHGEGVNVAARIEALAEPGGICISGSVHEQVRNRIEASYEDLGEKEVKHVSAPVRVYRVAYVDETVSQPGTQSEVLQDQPLALPDKPSIAVLPFDNMSKDPDQDYFSDGITEDIITALSRFPDLFVIARNSVFTYKGKPAKVQDVSAELGVRYVLEGSVRKAGERVRISAQLVDATTGHHLWAERYDRQLEDIFAVQDEITETIVGRLVGKLDQVERERAMHKGPDNLEAYDCYLRGLDFSLRFTKEGNAEARRMLEKAVERDPQYARAYMLLAWLPLQDVFMGWAKDPVASLGRALEMAEKAVALDNTDNRSHWVIGEVYLYLRQHDRAQPAYSRALELNANDADVLSQYGAFLMYVGEPEKGLEAIEKALRLNPHCPWWYFALLGWAKFSLGDCEEAIEAIERISSPIPECRLVTVASYVELGREEDARAEAAEVMKARPEFTLAAHGMTQPYQDAADLERFLAPLRKAGLPE